MKNLLGRSLAGAAVLLLAAMPAQAQLEETLQQLTGPQAKGYLAPLAGGLSATMNSGIFKSGDVPLLGLHLTLDVRTVIVSFSDDDRVYTTPAVGDFPSIQAPTVIGDPRPGSSATAVAPSGASITYPGGFDLNRFGIVVPQLTIGSVAGTRAIVRFIAVDLADEDEELGDLTFWGIGGQHSISRYLPGLPIDVAAGAMIQGFTIGKDDLVKSSAFALNVTGSKKLGLVISVEPYVGIGIDSFDMDAKYNLDMGAGQPPLPIEVNFDRQTDFHGTIGAGLNLPGIKLNGELNLAAVNGFAIGVSFGI